MSNDFNNVFSAGGLTFQIPHFTDIDGDGLLDLLVGDEFLSRYEQTAANGGTFSLLANQNFGPTADAGNGGAAACVTDLDGDGRLDMLVGRTNGQLFHHEQASANSTSFPSVATAFNGLNLAGYTAPAITDLDGDGLLDMLVGETGGTVVRYEQSSLLNSSNFINRGVLFANPDATTPANRFYARPTVTDLDNDGLLDILVGASDGRVRYYEQKVANVAGSAADFTDNGYLTNTAGTVIDGGDVTKVQVIDVDGDGVLDLLMGNAAGQVLQFTQSATRAGAFDQKTTASNSTTASFNNIALGNGQ